MTDHASCPHADGVICAATLDDAAADPALTLEGAREMLRDAAAAIRHFHGLAPPALSDDWARANVAHAVAPLQAEIEALRAEVELLNRILGRIVEGDGDSTLTIRVGTDAFAAAREYLLRDQEE